MRCNFPIDNSTCRIVNKDSPFDESNESTKSDGGSIAQDKREIFSEYANEMQFSDRQLNLSDRQ